MVCSSELYHLEATYQVKEPGVKMRIAIKIVAYT